MSQTIKMTVEIALSVVGLACLIWLAVRALKRAEDPAKIIFKWVFTIPFVLFCIWLARLNGAIWADSSSFSWEWSCPSCGRRTSANGISRPLTSLYDGGTEPPEPKPYYSIAQARRQRREFLQAVVAVREQLAKFPNDFEGVMLLADIQAEDLQDLPVGGNHVEPFLRPAESAAQAVCRRDEPTGRLASQAGAGR